MTRADLAHEPIIESGERRVVDLLAWWARRDPDNPAIIEGTDVWSFAEVATLVARSAAALEAAGIAPGDRVPIVCENTAAAVILLLAIQSLDAWPALVNARLPKAEIEAMMARVEPRWALYATDGSPSSALHADAVAATSWRPDILPGVRAGRFDADAAGEPRQTLASRQVGLLIFTSGTTGRPKAVMHSHAGLMSLGRVLAAARSTRRGDQLIGVAPLSHIMGAANLMTAVSAGASLRLQARATMAEVAGAIRSGVMTHLSFVPTAYSRLLEHIEENHLDMSDHGLKYMSAGGAPLDPVLKARVEKLFGLNLANGYGMTECAPGTRTPAGGGSSPTSIGFPEAGVEVRVVPHADVTAGTDIGELWLRSPSVMLGYYRDPAETERAMRPEGWIATGDLARQLPNGEFEIVGRLKEMIIRSGFNVYPVEVEQALNSIDGVAQSAVVGRVLEDGNEDIIAFVQLSPGSSLTVANLSRALREIIAPYKQPQRIVMVDEFPTSPNGKVLKARLRSDLLP